MRAGALLLGLAALLPACAIDPHGDPFPGRDARVALGEDGTGAAPWPAAWRRGARFVVENRSGRSLEIVDLDLSAGDPPRELVEAVVEDPAGVPATILPSPGGMFPLRCRLGEPGVVLLVPGGTLTVRVRVLGNPGRARAHFEGK